MKLDLDPVERRAASSLADDLERKARSWRRNRWISIATLIFAVGLFFATEYATRQMHEIFNREAPGYPTPTPDLNASRINYLESSIESRLSVMRTQLLFLLNPIILMIVATVFVGIIFSDKNRDKEYAFLAKLARAIGEGGGDLNQGTANKSRE